MKEMEEKEPWDWEWCSSLDFPKATEKHFQENGQQQCGRISRSLVRTFPLNLVTLEQTGSVD